MIVIGPNSASCQPAAGPPTPLSCDEGETLVTTTEPPGASCQPSTPPATPLSCGLGETLVTTSPSSAECQSSTTSSSPPTCEEGDLVNGQCVVEEPTPPPPTPEPEPEPEPSTETEPTTETEPETVTETEAVSVTEAEPEPAPEVVASDLAACLASSLCQILNRDIYQKAFAPMIPEYILQLRPELCLDTTIAEIANEIQAIPGVTLIHVYDLPGYQAVAFRGNPGPELLNDARFVDNNATSPTKAEINQFSGHTAQLAEPDNNTQVLEASQALPAGLKRTIQDLPSVNNPVIDIGANVTSTNMTATNASSLAVGCEMQRAVPKITETNTSSPDFNVDIAILDTGVSLVHPDLNVYKDVTFINGTTTGNDDNGHGSHVAGIAAARDNDLGHKGL